MVKENWTTANIRINLMKEIKKTIESDIGKKSGLINPNQFVDTAIRDLINKLESKRFSHQNTYDDKVRILDNKIGRMGDIVTIFLRDEFKKGFCDYCESENCVHVKYMWELPDVVKILKKRNFHSPYN